MMLQLNTSSTCVTKTSPTPLTKISASPTEFNDQDVCIKARSCPDLSLKQPYFDEMYEHDLQALNSKANVKEITDPTEASTLLSGDSRPIIYATDAALTEPEYSRQRAAAINFVQNGGIIIFGGQFSGRASPPKFKELFAEFSLPWKFGDYHRTVVDLNASMHQLRHAGLATRYSQKAVHLASVAREDTLYLPSAASRIQSMVFAPDPIDDLTQTPAAFGSFGRGKVGYIGDVNGEHETTCVLLAMCGLNV